MKFGGSIARKERFVARKLNRILYGVSNMRE